MDSLLNDLRFALRLLWKDRTFALTALLTLGLGLGANAAIFTVVRSVLLRPLPYPEPERLVFAYDAFPGAGVPRAGTSVPNYLDRLALAEVFEAQALFRTRGLDLGDAGSAERVTAMEVTPSFFRVLRTEAHRGRVFTEEEGQEGRGRVAILDYGYWQRAFSGADAAVGRELRLNGERYTVVGVMPPGFSFLDPDVRLWIPLAFTEQERAEDARYSQNHDEVGRLAAGAALAQAQQRLDAMNVRNLERAGPLKPLLVNAGYHTVLVPLAEDLVRDVRSALHLLWGGALFVLLIAAVNVANLVLVRANGRLRELSMRHTLGASFPRMARQLLTETTLLAFAGGLAGLAAGAAVLGWLAPLGLSDLPRGQEIRMDGTVVAFTLGLAALLGIVLGAVPLAHLAGLNLSLALREDARTGTAGRGARLVGRGLVLAQVALAFVLLIGAGLLFESFRQLLALDTGFRPAHVLTGQVNPPAARYADDPRLAEFTARALDRIRTLPGVEAAGVTSTLPFSDDSSSSVILAEGYVMAPGESVISPEQVRATPGYFEAMGIPLKRGRFFTESDVAGAPRVVVVDERLARKFWPNADPVGRRMFMPQRPEDLVKPGPDALWLQVVGVVGTVRMRGLAQGQDTSVGAYYFPYAQDPVRGIGFAIRTQDDPVQVTAAVRRVLAVLDPELSFYDVLAMPERVERSLDQRRTPMLLALAFGAVALLLASVGIYGVLSYQVSQRTREIGIRMALGSDALGAVRLVLREGALLVTVGLAIGIAGAAALGRIIASQLYGVGALDPIVLVTVTVVLAGAALLACLAPARRAARVDPVTALNQT